MTRTRRLLIWSVVAVVGLSWWFPAQHSRHVAFPNGKRFAFSIIDDTDLTTLERVRPVYDTLSRYGLKTTKTIWVTDASEPHDANLGDTLRDPAYREFVKDLGTRGFEIALHGVRGGSSRRAEIAEGLEVFRHEIGYYPRMQINHSRNRDNLYWDKYRFGLIPFRLAAAIAMTARSSGHDPQSEFFWGDLAKAHIQYVRQFTFQEINLLQVNPSLPFRRADTPYVNYWFPTSNGANRDAFAELLTPENLDKLEREGGVSLVYAHLGAGSFNTADRVHPTFEARIQDLASRNGWFAPASDILDYLRGAPGWTGEVGLRERLSVETRFTIGRITGGGS